MKTRLRITLKLLLILMGIICLFFLLEKDKRIFRMKQPQGEGIEAEDIVILMEAFSKQGSLSEETGKKLKEWIVSIRQSYENDQNCFLYEDYIELITLLSGDEKLFLESKYNNDFYLLKKDWYESFDVLLKYYGLDEKIKLIDISLLSGGKNLVEEDTGNTIEKSSLLAAEGRLYEYKSKEFKNCSFIKAAVYVCEDVLLTIKEKKEDPFTLENIWIMEVDDSKIIFFAKGFEVSYNLRQGEIHSEAVRERVADLTFAKGKLQSVKQKEERISGRLLRFTQEELELFDKGTYRIQDNCKVYQLFEEFRETGFDDLRIGYDFADYVLDEGEICAILITRKENMESIRVALQSSNFESLYHDSIEFMADCDMEMIYGPYEERKEKLIRTGEKIKVDRDSHFLEGDRIELVPSAKSGKIKVVSVIRNQGVPEYRGKMEIVKTDEGIVLINELLLEEYLYSVVPSEMPALYPPEALKAQAVCARTYAYRYLLHPGLPDIGAHVDDSVSYQVYNNISENINSTRAVKETTGTLLYYEEEVVNTYYYSTSCGFGTDAGIWGEENKEKFPYLTSGHIAEIANDGGNDDKTKQKELTEEEAFRDYILTVHENDYEKEEGWYRWEYDVEKLDVEKMSERLQKSFKVIYDIRIAARREGGVADILILDTDKGTFEVTGEYNIRYILNNGGIIKKQDGTETQTGKILPSAYFLIDVVKKEESVVGYTIFGGGYGHGVGMSQNGAKAMGNKGRNFEEVLTFFYPGCHLKKMY